MDTEQSKVHGLENMNRTKKFMLTVGYVLEVGVRGQEKSFIPFSILGLLQHQYNFA